MKRPPLPYLVLLPLLAVLLFGNCGGGVRGFLSGLGTQRREKMRALVLQRQAERAAAKQQLRGAARQDAYEEIEKRIDARLDSLVPTNRTKKFHNRRNKIERQLLRLPPGAPVRTPLPLGPH